MRYTVRDAADRLGISEGAIRNRLSRGTLAGVKEGGATYVVLEGVTNDIPPTDAATDHRDELITVLREQLEAERDANRENRRIIMQQAQNLAAIEAPESSAQNEHLDEEEPPAPEESTEGSNRSPNWRSWWRRIFGG